jgi:hypothetical protein
MKLILVSIHIKKSVQSMPLACAMIKAVLDEKSGSGHQISISDFYLSDDCGLIADGLLSQCPDMIGFSTYMWNREHVVRISEMIRQKRPSVMLFAGGAEPTASPGSLLEDAPLDFEVSGEGEKTMLSVMEMISEGRTPRGIPGVWMKGDDGQRDKPPETYRDLNGLPSPFLSGTLDPKRYDGVLWELSRGCPFGCDFCFESRGIAGVRRYSLDRIEAELSFFEAEKVSQVFVLDPTFNNDGKRVGAIINLIRRISPQIHFTFEIRAEFLDERTAEMFGSINCGLQIGLQSSSPEVLAGLNRKFDPEKFSEKIGLLNAAGAVFGFDLIYGLPGDDLRGFMSSMDYAVSLQPNNLDIFPLSMMPGTALHDKADNLKIIHSHSAPYGVVSTPTFGKEDLDKAAVLAKSCDLFYNRGGAVGWLFIVLNALDMKPSDFFDGFSKTLGPEKGIGAYDRSEITGLQIGFVGKLFALHGKTGQFAAAENMIRYNEALEMSLFAGCDVKSVPAGFDESTVFRLCRSTILVVLDYDPEDLMQLDEYDLAEFERFFPKEKTFVVVYNRCGDVRCETLDGEWFGFLGMMDGKMTLGEISRREGIAGQVREFAGFAAGECMIETV